jgi:hypothetical protein
LVIDGGYLFVEGFHIVLEMILLLAQKARDLLIFQQLFLNVPQLTSQNLMLALKFYVLP